MEVGWGSGRSRRVCEPRLQLDPAGSGVYQTRGQCTPCWTARQRGRFSSALSTLVRCASRGGARSLLRAVGRRTETGARGARDAVHPVSGSAHDTEDRLAVTRSRMPSCILAPACPRSPPDCCCMYLRQCPHALSHERSAGVRGASRMGRVGPAKRPALCPSSGAARGSDPRRHPITAT